MLRSHERNLSTTWNTEVTSYVYIYVYYTTGGICQG
jgi:hypothetical protein